MSDKLKLTKSTDSPWYKEGLNFQCTGCGRCCTGAPGVVYISDSEIEKMADFLKISIDLFARRYLRRVNNKLALVEIKPHYDCVFLKNKQCTVYSCRPKQCRTFPFWSENLTSPEAWQRAARECEGINENAPIIDLKTIQSNLKERI